MIKKNAYYANTLSFAYHPCVVYLAIHLVSFSGYMLAKIPVPWMRHGCLLCLLQSTVNISFSSLSLSLYTNLGLPPFEKKVFRQETASHKKPDALCLRCMASNFNHPPDLTFFPDAFKWLQMGSFGGGCCSWYLASIGGQQTKNIMFDVDLL